MPFFSTPIGLTPVGGHNKPFGKFLIQYAERPAFQAVEHLEDTGYLDPEKYDTVSLNNLPEGAGYRSTYERPDYSNVIDNTEWMNELSQTLNQNLYFRSEKPNYYGMSLFWFNKADIDFLNEAAKQYAQLEDHQELRWEPTQSSHYIYSMLDFLGNGQWEEEEYYAAYNQLRGDFAALSRELGERMKNGESTDLDSLETRLTVFGTQLSITQLVDLQEKLQALPDLSDYFGPTRTDLNSFARMGLVKSMASALAADYADLGGDFSTKLEEALCGMADRVNQAHTDNLLMLEEPSFSTKFDKHKAKVGAQAAEMFSHLDYSSKEAYIASYQKQRGLLSGMLTEYQSYMGIQSIGKNAILADIDQAFQVTLDALFS